MARPKKTDAPDTTQAIELTAGVIERLTCPTGSKAQAFLRDAKVPGLRVRVTNTGAKSFVFEAKLNRQTIRRTIGDVRVWTIEKARTEARRLAVMLDSGNDPRELERQEQAQKAAQAAELAAQGVTVGEAWAHYLEDRRPHWGELHYRDHIIKASPGGEPSKRRGQTDRKTQPGPLASLMPLRLCELNTSTVEQWAATEGKTRPASARLAWRLLSVFLTWCAEQPKYAGVVPSHNPAKSRKARESLGRAGVKSAGARPMLRMRPAAMAMSPVSSRPEAGSMMRPCSIRIFMVYTSKQAAALIQQAPAAIIFELFRWARHAAPRRFTPRCLPRCSSPPCAPRCRR